MRTEAEQEENDEVNGGDGVVVPEEIGWIENDKEVVERNRGQAKDGSNESCIVPGLEANIEHYRVHQQLGKVENERTDGEETDSG